MESRVELRAHYKIRVMAETLSDLVHFRRAVEVLYYAGYFAAVLVKR